MECHPHSHTVYSVVDHDSIHLRGEKNDIAKNMYVQGSFLRLFTSHFTLQIVSVQDLNTWVITSQMVYHHRGEPERALHC